LTHGAPPHDFPHAPQLSGSSERVAQVFVPLQYVSDADPHSQLPLTQTSGAPQSEPGQLVPQFEELVLRLTQPIAPPQLVSPTPHPHLPPTHVSPAAHALLQRPQFFGSLSVSTHDPDAAPKAVQ
jgi:hypothetical protein